MSPGKGQAPRFREAPLLDKAVFCAYNNSEERTTHTVSSSNYRMNMWQSHKVNRHLSGVAVDFFMGFAFAFLEVFRTMIVTVYFPMWKVRRIRITPFRE